MKMIRPALISTFATILFLTACTPTLNVAWRKNGYTGEVFQKLVVVAITERLEVRNSFEETAVKLFRQRGIQAYRGIDYFPPDLDPKLHTKESLRKIIEDNEIDGVITMSLVDEEESQQYIQGTTYTAPNYYDPYGYYMHYRYTTVYQPGYYVNSKKYIIEAVLHDLNKGMDKEDRLVFRGQSDLVDPTSIRAASLEFNKGMVNYLVKNNIVQKAPKE